MLKKEEVLNPNAVETHLCNVLDNSKKVELNKEEFEFLLFLLSQKDEDSPNPKDIFGMDWQYKAIEFRLTKVLNLNSDKRFKIFLVYLTNGSIGELMMYCYYIKYLCNKLDVDKVTIELFAQKLFPKGVFGEGDLKSAWELQKVQKYKDGTDNLIDYISASESLINYKKQ